ncbi:hypothetical protein M758_UG234600 [Ceratodon purpureus]|nr:hypothetical protein M758_UG234600 [Ceratodon purpureus]
MLYGRPRSITLRLKLSGRKGGAGGEIPDGCENHLVDDQNPSRSKVWACEMPRWHDSCASLLWLPRLDCRV